MPPIHISVGSTNPCKLGAVKQAFEEAFSSEDQEHVQVIIKGYDVSSGVRSQPFGDYETKLGARNRAQAAYELAKADGQCPDFTVGLEGGLILEEPKQVWCMAWMAIARVPKGLSETKEEEDEQQQQQQQQQSALSWSFSKTGCFLLPSEIVRLILNENMELGAFCQ